MSITKGTFLLHYDRDFTPGSSELVFDSLIPYTYRVNEEGGWFMTTALFFLMVFGLVSSIVALYFTVIVPLRFERASQETTGQVIECRMQARKIGDVPVISYTYTWDNREFTGSSDLVGADMGNCSRYVDQTLVIVIMTADPGQSYAKISQTPYAATQRTAMIGGFLFIGIASLYYLYQALYTFYVYRHAKRIYSRLQHGTLLEGKITRVSGRLNVRPPEFIITLSYSFETPDKRRTRGWAQIKRGTMLSVLPEVGERLAILYADDSAYMAL